ncbi:MAG TPA: molybdopterin-dependent oxidoreductase [Chloroflexia bacterium]
METTNTEITPATQEIRPAAQPARKQMSLRGGFGAGVGAAIVMMIVMAILRFTSNTISIPELMEESLVRLAGGQLESYLINALGVGGKALLLVTIVEGTLLLGGLLGLLFARFWPVHRSMHGWRWFSGLLFGLIVGAFLNVVFLPLVQQGFFGSTALQATAPPEISQALYGNSIAPWGVPVALNMFILSIAFGLTLVNLLPWPRTEPAVATGQVAAVEPATTGTVGRRGFVRALGGGTALALLGGGALWYLIKEAIAAPPVAGVQVVEGSAGQPGGGPDPTQQAMAQATQEAIDAGAPEGFQGVKPLLVPEVTPTDSFYITTKNFLDPTVDGNTWTLSFKGLVENPYSITLKELQAMKSEDRVETLACISNPVGGSLIGNGRWKGVSFADLIKRAKPKSGVVDVIVRGADGYSDSFTLDVAMENNCLLAYEMNGAPLNQKHGYPARLLVPGIFGMKNCKWINEVELVSIDYKGYWQNQGWSDPAPYLTMSRIDYPDKDRIEAKPVYIGGIAFAGDRGIKRVEVSTDDGQTWNDADLRPTMSEYAWAQWTYPWKPEPGQYTLQVRATDGKGEVQTSQVANTYPDGATGYHSRKVRVS